MIRWADERFLYYVKKQGPLPARKSGIHYAKHSMKGSLQHLLAFIIGAIFLVLLIVVVGDSLKTEVLLNTLQLWALILGIDFFISLSFFIWPRPVKVK